MKKENHRIGDIKVVEFIKNQRDGRKPVCMINGIICFIDRAYRGKFIQEHSVWHVEINEIKDRVMVVTPIQEIKSAFENQRETQQRMKLLTIKYAPKHEPKRDNLKKHYQYKSKQEHDMDKQ